MADNVSVTEGSGKTIATDDVGGVQHQLVKIEYGTDGSATMVSGTNPLPITGTVTANTGLTQPLTDTELRATPVPVSASSLPLPTGAATSAKQDTGNNSLSTIAGAVAGTEMQVDVVGSIPAGDNNIGNIDLASAIPAGTNAIGKLLPPDVDVTGHTNYIRKYYTSAGAAIDGIIWSPASGKRWHVVSMYIQTSAAATITLEDDKAGGDDPVWKGEFAANSGVAMYFGEKYPMASGEDEADLIITTSAGNCYVTITGYEV